MFSKSVMRRTPAVSGRTRDHARCPACARRKSGSQVARDEWGETWYWSFTSLSPGLFGDAFGKTVSVVQHGNVLAATAFLYGVAEHELTRVELAYNDPVYPVCITVRAVKGGIEPAP
jgi:hypothetical protein